ncbi:MAG: HAD family hydrolase [Lactobacillales bacterium]|nr:HAD family hydrolase [Lactobacillales bacterium]
MRAPERTKKPDVVIWDWDNTLVDAMPAAVRTMNEVCQKFGIPQLSMEEILYIFGRRRADSFWNQFGEKQTEIESFFRERFHHNSMRDIALMPGAKEVLDFVKSKGIEQVVASNKNHDMLVEESRQLGVYPYFSAIKGVSGSSSSKPYLDFAKELLSGIAYQTLVVIGDGASDMQFGSNLGAVRIFVRPHLSEREKIEFDYHAMDLKEVGIILKRILGEVGDE